MRPRCPNVVLARQPIVDRNRAIVAYELLYRSSADRSAAVFIDDAFATLSVVHAAFLRIGISAVVGRARAFINVNAEFLLDHRVERLPPNQVMLEILETVDIDEQIVRRCRALKEKGYQLTLDDVSNYSARVEPLLEFIDVVKIDVMQLDSAALRSLVRRLRPWPARLLAEKVNTASQVKECLELGMDWLQGFFCGQPVCLAA